MYRPADMLTPTYPVPKKVNGRVVSFISGRAFLAVLLVAALGYGAYTLTGGITRQGSVEMTAAELVAVKAEYKDALYVAKCDELEEKVGTGAASAEERSQLASARSRISALSQEEREGARALAREAGIGPGMTEAEATALAPSTKEAEVEAFDARARAMACVLAPVTVALMLVVEPAGMRSIAKLAGDRVEYGRRRHEYTYRRRR